MHRVHVPGAGPPDVTVTGNEARHIARVLRLSAGDHVVVFDGRGHEWLGRITSTARTTVAIELRSQRVPVAEPKIEVTLGVAVLKGSQFDDVVRDATMLGVVEIVPFVSAHVALSEQAWKQRSIDRWERIASSSASQCRRAVVPRLSAVTSLASLLSTDGFDLIVMCVEPASGCGAPVTSLPFPSRVLLLVGPEGGWSPEEVEAARAARAAFVSLGPRTLRAETAPAVALSALWTHWGWE